MIIFNVLFSTFIKFSVTFFVIRHRYIFYIKKRNFFIISMAGMTNLYDKLRCYTKNAFAALTSIPILHAVYAYHKLIWMIKLKLDMECIKLVVLRTLHLSLWTKYNLLAVIRTKATADRHKCLMIIICCSLCLEFISFVKESNFFNTQIYVVQQRINEWWVIVCYYAK